MANPSGHRSGGIRMEQTQSPIACRLDRLSETEREREKVLLQLIREATLERSREMNSAI